MVKSRKGYVRICNLSGEPIANINVMHRYSNKFVNNYLFDDILDNGQTTNPTMIANFNTGLLSFGTDR
jgi:hypothetical protein